MNRKQLATDGKRAKVDKEREINEIEEGRRTKDKWEKAMGWKKLGGKLRE